MDESSGLEGKVVTIGDKEADRFLIGGLQHYFNNLLSGVGSYAKFLLDMQIGMPVTQQNLQDADRIVKSSDRMTSIILDLKNAISPEMSYEPVDLYELVNQVIDNESKKEHIKIMPRKPPTETPMIIEGDLKKLEAALRGIISDAQYCYSNGDFSVDIGKDNGYGVIRFDYKGNNINTINCQESLGLFMAYRVAKMHEGSLTITTYNGRETIELKLPIKKP